MYKRLRNMPRCHGNSLAISDRDYITCGVDFLPVYSTCMSVGWSREPRKSGWTDQDAVWRVNSYGACRNSKGHFGGGWGVNTLADPDAPDVDILNFFSLGGSSDAVSGSKNCSNIFTRKPVSALSS